jgi:polo-like kinase 1
LAVAPTLEYIRRFMPNADENGICHLNDDNEKAEENTTKEKNEKKEKDVASTKKDNPKQENPKTNNNENELNLTNTLNKLKNPEIFVTKWVDYSSKYGLGYLLNNGFIGVFFNDYTKIFYNIKNNKINYVERKMSQEIDMIYSFDIDGAPKELHKKILIFQNFKKYFEEEIRAEKEEKEKEKGEEIKTSKTVKKQKEKKLQKTSTNIENAPAPSDNVFVKKWMKTKQAVIFRLSNKTIQFSFKDHTELLLYNDTVSYKNKKGEIKLFTIEEALNGAYFEMIKRIKYAQNILTKMVNSNLKKQ